jgi:hypothetical protein
MMMILTGISMDQIYLLYASIHPLSISIYLSIQPYSSRRELVLLQSEKHEHIIKVVQAVVADDALDAI